MFLNSKKKAAMLHKLTLGITLGVVLAILLGAGLARPAEALLPVASLTISDAEGYETCPAASPAVKHPVFTIRLIRPAAGPFVTETVHYATQNGTAIAGQDYVAKNGVLTFAPNESTKTLQINLITDSTGTAEFENQNFSVVLSNPSLRLRTQDLTGVALIWDIEPSTEECQRHPDIPVDEPFPSPGDDFLTVEDHCDELGIKCIL
ncbi:MAG: Calx-beta domain-containing protein [Candidatus Competibacter phosphatis]